MVYVVKDYVIVNDNKRKREHIIITYHSKFIFPYYFTGIFQCSINKISLTRDKGLLSKRILLKVP